MSITIDELIWDRTKGRDVLTPVLTLDFDPKAHETCESAARAFHKEIVKAAEVYGQDPETEVSLRTPEEAARAGCGNNWQVTWEAGPFEFAIPLSFKVCNPPHWFTEPYYSFDLCFTEG